MKPGRSIDDWTKAHPILGDVIALRETAWEQRGLQDAKSALAALPFGMNDILDASGMLGRFRPLVARLFPETAPSGGLIESGLLEIPRMADFLGFKGRLLLKPDSDLPIAGSVKARGGIYEILKLAETVARDEGGFERSDDYATLADQKFRSLFGEREVVVGSTGNLGLSIGIVSARLGFRVTVHMSSDAKQWKKDKLRANGVAVVEYRDDYSRAVAEGRRQAESNARAHFVDDENSVDLFMGYAVAALRLKPQLAALKIFPTESDPMDVYLPCGVGGAPAGITFGLKHVFGDGVRCWLVEPTHSPCMLLGLVTGMQDLVCVQDFGLDNKTEADGLAVGRASKLAGKLSGGLFSGVHTVDDGRLKPWVRALHETERLFIEPSAAAAFIGPETRRASPLSLIWATGGSLVPDAVRNELLR